MQDEGSTHSKSYYPQNVNVADANMILEAWQNKREEGTLWFVFVSCNHAEPPVRFVYSFVLPPEMTSREAVACAKYSHKEAGRPPEVDNVEVLRVTQEIVDRLKAGRCIDPDKGLCDFCGVQDVLVITYSARDFVMQNGTMSMGGWKACARCSALIDADDRDGLVGRVAESLGIGMARRHDIAKRQVADFFSHRLFQ
jgi:hypothetical protein